MFQKTVEYYQLDIISTIGKRTTKMMQEMMTDFNNYNSHENINRLLGEEIAKKLFYNLCTISITGNCQSCKKDGNALRCQSYVKSSPKDIEHCDLVNKKRGFQTKHINLHDEMFITFTYPSITEKIFSGLFLQHKDHIRENIGNLIRINHNHFLLEHDAETGVFNATKLEIDVPDGKEKTVVLMHISGYHHMVTTLRGKHEWTSIMKEVAIFLQNESGATIYRYNEMTFCLTYEFPSKF